MKIENTKFIFLAFKRVLNYSEEKTINIIKELIKTHLKAKKITKKVLINLFNTLNEYCKNIFNMNITKNTFKYDITTIIIRFNY